MTVSLRFPTALFLLALPLFGQDPQEPAQEQDPLLTQCEASGYTEYTSYDNQMEYLKAVQASSTEMKMGIYGTTWEGRELPYAVFSRPTVTQPWEAMVLGKPIIMFQGNVHGGERTLRESLLILIRELATKGTAANDMLDALTIVIAPQVNPDGFENEPRSTRGNSWGLDLNRDYMKLEQAAIGNLVTNMYQRWHPHLIVDGHNGGARPYNINYITTGNAAPDQSLVDLCNNEIFPLVWERMNDNDLKAFYYPGGNAEFWRGAPTYPRISMSYACLSNALGITFESPGQPMEVGIPAGYISFMAVLEYSAANSAKVLETVNQARRKTIALGENPGGDVMVEMEVTDQDYPVSYEIRGENPGEYITIENGKLRTKPVITKTRPRPYAYILPRQARQTVELLRRHNITVEVLQEATELSVQGYTVKDITYAREYDHDASVRVEVDEVVTVERTFPAGTFVVYTAQMMGRVVTYLLEPETDDNVIRWNTMDALLPQTRFGAQAEEAAAEQAARRAQAAEAAARRGRSGQRGQGRRGRGRRGRRGRGGDSRPILPILKLMEPTPLATRILH
jgi:hypothetical protein